MNQPIGRRQQGLTLVEILVALVISLVLMIGVAQIFVANKVTYRTQEGLARLQENGRYAINRIAKSVRQAGFFGCAGMEVTNLFVIANDPPADLSSITTKTAIDGDDNVTAGNPFSAKVGTDVITLRGAGDEGMGLTGGPTDRDSEVKITNGYNRFAADDLVLITDCRSADLFRATGVSSSEGKTNITHAAASNTSNRLSRDYLDDGLVLKPFIHSYFIKDTGRDNQAGDDIYALYYQDTSGTVFELVEGVSDLQVLYGVDQDGNRAADIYQTATAIDAANAWDRVVSARISILVDSVENVLQQKQESYTIAGATSIPADGDLRLRQEFSRLVAIRNRTL
jgi:type IV pilus assembly protein PilW